MTPQETADEMRRLNKLLDDALAYLRRQVQEYAEAEDAYRMAHAKAFLEAAGAAYLRKATADLATSSQRQRAHLADGMRQAALEAVRSRRAQISAAQSLLAGEREEMAFARTGPP